MKIRNTNPLGAVMLRDLGYQEVGANEVIQVDTELGVRLLEQPENWAPVDADAKAAVKAAESPDEESSETNT